MRSAEGSAREPPLQEHWQLSHELSSVEQGRQRAGRNGTAADSNFAGV